MSDFLFDSFIVILLIMSVGFGGIGVIGLFLFPDIRSRMFTAFRATIISFSMMTLAVIMYALYTLQSTGGGQYSTLMFHSVILLGIVIIASIVHYNTIISRTRTMTNCQKLSDQPTVKK